nr:MAG TPA: hypothetical protein [Caudoviricetes sp.]
MSGRLSLFCGAGIYCRLSLCPANVAGLFSCYAL